MNKKAVAAVVAVPTTLVLIAGTGLAISATRGPQHSDADKAFLSLLNHEGIDVSSEDRADQMIDKGHSVCQSLDNGATLLQLGMGAIADPSLTMEQHGTVIIAGVSSYCPEHLESIAAQAKQLSSLGGTNA
ncbi:hypothetical protein SEA_TYPHA_55 [Mycobacterium phage Typha]|uniref:DUF732 domain-containing protein n=1 Tax=Mycobacterium phage Typha TaxID=2517971 RepID=A0A482J6M3_9CAUD|nr:hypothetical protein KCH40_gp114 [Mycobacterium phage Typha]QBP29710.1 hypothetical protein SEA_TYPHA_55 [Mycobacterium phage Typha]